MATIILVHGMGQHTDESFKNDFINACEKAFDLYFTLHLKGKRLMI